MEIMVVGIKWLPFWEKTRKRRRKKKNMFGQRGNVRRHPRGHKDFQGEDRGVQGVRGEGAVVESSGISLPPGRGPSQQLEAWPRVPGEDDIPR